MYGSGMSSVETAYDDFRSNLGKILPKVDIELLLQVMYYERKMPDVFPSVGLEIHYKSRANVERKRDEIISRYSFQVALHGKNGILVRGNMNTGMIQEISNDPQVERITGTASIASY